MTIDRLLSGQKFGFYFSRRKQEPKQSGYRWAVGEEGALGGMGLEGGDKDQRLSFARSIVFVTISMKHNRTSSSSSVSQFKHTSHSQPAAS